MANEYNTLITFESKNHVEILRMYNFVKELGTIDRYGVVHVKGMTFHYGGLATFEIKVIGYNDSGVEPFYKAISECFSDISIYYISNDGCDCYFTNDENGKYYPIRYELELYSDNPAVTDCSKIVFNDYDDIKRYLQRKYNYELGEGVSFQPNAISDTYNVKISEYEVVC